MKKFKIFFSVLALGLVSVACNDLDQLPNGGTVTADQKEEAIQLNPSLASAGVNALPQQLNQYMSIFGNHLDYGWPSVMISTDTRGIDMPSDLTGYNWYTPALEYEDWGGRYYLNLLYWYYNYYTIRTANSLTASIPVSENHELNYYRAQALAFRGFCYFNLAQMYQFTYAKDPNALCVPVITEENMTQVASDGCHASTVAQVYAQVLADLTEADNLLKDAEEQGISRFTMTTSNMAKTFVDRTVVLGLRARAYLFMQNWQEALKDATDALALCEELELTPYSQAEAAVPGFTSNLEHNYLWGNFCDPSLTRYRGVATFASHMSGFQTNGYAPTGTYRRINPQLYNSISDTDSRKAWWINGKNGLPKTLPSAYANYIKTGYADMGNAPFPPYATLKFGAYGNEPASYGCVDQPFMRVEELYLMQAEAAGMIALGDGVAKLTSFVTTYRDPNYSFRAGSTEEFQNEIWRQRRIEFWGEGLSYWDIMRYQKGLDRRGCGFDKTVVFVIDPDNTVMLYDIPESEIQRNPLLGRTANGSTTPTPVDDVVE